MRLLIIKFIKNIIFSYLREFLMKTRMYNIYWLTICVLACLTNIAMADDVDKSKVDKLDKQFINLSNITYSDSSLYKKNSIKISNKISSLYSKVKALNEAHNYPAALIEIHANKALIKKNIDNESIYYFLNLLLSHNDWILASSIYAHIIKEGDKSLISNVKYIFAKYHYFRNEWNKTLTLLSGINSDLGVNEGHYALVMNGIVLQKLKKHREALKFYNQVPIKSKYYNYAQLNKATVNIRQGWWSDAHIIINKLLTSNESKPVYEEEFINRLYLVLGYSFLQQEYFRESRNSFRNIRKYSQYSNRALLGISLAAANQGDNIGALNILNILQEEKTRSLSTEESYLLLPYIYERLGQYKTASASYTIALRYYQTRIKEVENILISIKTNPHNLLPDTENTLIFKGTNIHISSNKELANIKNRRELITLKSIAQDKKTHDIIDKLIFDYDLHIAEQATRILQKTLYNLKSYLNQSQYGIARLYDNSKSEL